MMLETDARNRQMDICKPDMRQRQSGKSIKKYKATRRWANDMVRYFTEEGAVRSIDVWKDS